MGHEDAGHYAAKHPEGTKSNPDIERMLKEKISNDQISCAAAHGIAKKLNVPPADVGVAIDLLEARICKCQLGLFGYQPEKRIVAPAESPSPAIKAAIESDLEDGRIACLKTWQIADRMGEKKMAVSNVCEGMGVKVSTCQLGAF